MILFFLDALVEFMTDKFKELEVSIHRKIKGSKESILYNIEHKIEELKLAVVASSKVPHGSVRELMAAVKTSLPISTLDDFLAFDRSVNEDQEKKDALVSSSVTVVILTTVSTIAFLDIFELCFRSLYSIFYALNLQRLKSALSVRCQWFLKKQFKANILGKEGSQKALGSWTSVPPQLSYALKVRRIFIQSNNSCEVKKINGFTAKKKFSILSLFRKYWLL